VDTSEGVIALVVCARDSIVAWEGDSCTCSRDALVVCCAEVLVITGDFGAWWTVYDQFGDGDHGSDFSSNVDAMECGRIGGYRNGEATSIQGFRVIAAVLKLRIETRVPGTDDTAEGGRPISIMTCHGSRLPHGSRKFEGHTSGDGREIQFVFVVGRQTFGDEDRFSVGSVVGGYCSFKGDAVEFSPKAPGADEVEISWSHCAIESCEIVIWRTWVFDDTSVCTVAGVHGAAVVVVTRGIICRLNTSVNGIAGV